MGSRMRDRLICTRVAATKVGSLSRKAVLFAIASHADPSTGENSHPSIETICAESETDRATVYRARARLKADGHLSWTEHPSKGTVYSVHPGGKESHPATDQSHPATTPVAPCDETVAPRDKTVAPCDSLKDQDPKKIPRRSHGDVRRERENPRRTDRTPEAER